MWHLLSRQSGAGLQLQLCWEETGKHLASMQVRMPSSGVLQWHRWYSDAASQWVCRGVSLLHG